MTAMVSDPQGRLLAADEHIIDPDEFSIFDPFSFRIRFPGPVDFGRIRVLPRA